MKRWVAFGIVLIILIAAGCLLTRTAVDPTEFTGNWYGAEDGRLYRFQEGIIESSGTEFCGAYWFCKDRILLFTVNTEGQSVLKELYPAGDPKGEFLCETPDGSGRIVFSRSNIAAQSRS